MRNWFRKILAPKNRQAPLLATVDIRPTVDSMDAIKAGADEQKKLGDQYLKQGNWGEAANCYRKAIAIDPRQAKAHGNLGFVLMEIGQFDAAEASLGEALVLDPGNADTHYMLAIIARNSGRFDLADQYFRGALALAVDFDAAFSDWYGFMASRAQLDQVKQFLTTCIEKNPGRADFHYYLGVLHNDQEQGELAVDCLRKSLSLRPEHPDALANLGFALSKQGFHEQSDAAYREAVELLQHSVSVAPNDAAAFVSLGRMLTSLNRVDEAFAAFDRALSIDATFGEARLGRGWIALLKGEYEQGWKDYKDIVRYTGTSRHHFDHEPWLGNPDINGKSIFVFADQGMGDTIQFARYVNQLGTMGAKVYLEVHPQLATLFDSLAGVTQILHDGDAMPAFAYYCPMSNLCLAFNAGGAPIPAAVPYLAPPPDRLAHWARKLQHDAGPRIGVVWSGNPLFKNDKYRSIHLQVFSALLKAGQHQFFSLQKDVRSGDAPILASLPHVINLDSELTDFTETAAVIANLDLVITVDTSVAHLAGALGKPVWILLPFAPDFRWLLQRADTPWYPTARLFRQPAIGDWGSVVREVIFFLDVFLAEKSS
jgi:tetratricopeptide (TPR) repeat protein